MFPICGIIKGKGTAKRKYHGLTKGINMQAKSQNNIEKNISEASVFFILFILLCSQPYIYPH